MAASVLAAKWDDWGIKDWYNNGIGKWQPFKWSSGKDKNPRIEYNQAQVKSDPLMNPNPSVASVFTSGGALNLIKQSFLSFNAGEAAFVSQTVQGIKAIAANPSMLFTKEAYFGALSQGLEILSPQYGASQANARLQKAGATGNVGNFFYTLGGEYASFMTQVAAVAPVVRGASAVGTAGRVATGGRLGNTVRASTNVLSKSQMLRIENAATRINKPITVVGSRARGTAGAYSDWDYVIQGLNSKNWSKIKNSLPGSRYAPDNIPRNIDVFNGPINKNLPYITIYPR